MKLELLKLAKIIVWIMLVILAFFTAGFLIVFVVFSCPDLQGSGKCAGPDRNSMTNYIWIAVLSALWFGLIKAKMYLKDEIDFLSE